MPYLNPENENDKAKAYFDENKDKIAECFAGCIECIDDVGFFISPTDNSPYLVIIFNDRCPWEPFTPQLYTLENIMEGIMKSYRAFPHLTHAPIYLYDIYDFLVVKRDGSEAGFTKLLWPNEVAAPDNEYGV
ncbi:hypothetical protein F5Y13DRAFT_189399 [Hypoxylon sp. FL1857]|nr:hypothetical protein F5Y13DRAFT_189399 [Hypoxylon sp. FL1857]